MASLKLHRLRAGVKTLREFLSSDCAWIDFPMNTSLTLAALDHIRATKLCEE